MKKLIVAIFTLCSSGVYSQNIDCKDWETKNSDLQLNIDVSTAIQKTFIAKGSKGTFVAHCISGSWKTSVNDLDVPVTRSLEVLVMSKGKDDVCTFSKGLFTQKHISGGKFGKPAFEFTENMLTGNCSCVEKANSWKVPSQPEPGIDPLNSN